VLSASLCMWESVYRYVPMLEMTALTGVNRGSQEHRLYNFLYFSRSNLRLYAICLSSGPEWAGSWLAKTLPDLAETRRRTTDLFSMRSISGLNWRSKLQLGCHRRLSTDRSSLLSLSAFTWRLKLQLFCHFMGSISLSNCPYYKSEMGPILIKA
jgi:hypothetical protein